VTRRDDRPPYDEAFDDAGTPRPHYAGVLAGLDDPGALRAEALRRLDARGVTFGGETASFDPVPRVLTEPEWSELRAGIGQRLRALEAFAGDVYGEGRVFEAGVVTREEVESSPHHEPAMRGATPRRWIAFAGLDVVRCEDGALEIALEASAAKTLVNDLSRKLQLWTGRSWMVVISREPGQPTLKSVADARKAELEVGVRADPLVKAVLERFPGAEIVGVRGAKDSAPEPSSVEPEIPLPDDIGFGDNWERDE